MATQSARRRPRTAIGHAAFAALQRGDLFLRHIVGLTDDEMAAIEELARRARASAQLDEAAAIYGLLIAYDPLRPRYWRSLAELQQDLSNPCVALAAYEVLAVLEDRTDTSTLRQAECLEKMNHPQLAAELKRLALSQKV